MDFNPTYFSHPLAENGTLTDPNEEIRAFWIRHGIACIRISEYFARETGFPCLMNIWIPDGFKDIPADRLGPRMRFMDSLDQILGCGYDKELVYVTLESKVFGIGLESYTVGSNDFYIGYGAQNNKIVTLDTGHFHPTESVADKLSSLLLYVPEVMLHVSRPVRWDSDHVTIINDETLDLMQNGAEGVISVASNIVPSMVADLTHAMLEGNVEAAQKLHETLSPLFRDCFIESNPIPTKAALSAMGFIQNECRLPLVPASQGAYDQMLQTIQVLPYAGNPYLQ